MRSHPVAEELVAFDSFWERENRFSLMVWHLVYQSYSRVVSTPESILALQTRFVFQERMRKIMTLGGYEGKCRSGDS